MYVQLVEELKIAVTVTVAVSRDRKEDRLFLLIMSLELDCLQPFPQKFHKMNMLGS